MPELPKRLVAWLSSITFGTYLLALGLGVVLLVASNVGQDLLGHQGGLVVGAFLLEFAIPTVRINLLAGFIGLLMIYAACVITAAKTKGGFAKNLRELASGIIRRIPNWLVVMPLASSALLVVVVIITAIQNLFAFQTGSLSFPASYTIGQQLYVLTYSPVVEEFAFRITTLGLLVSLRVVWSEHTKPDLDVPKRTPRLVFLGFFFPDRAKVEAGIPSIASNGWRGIRTSEWALLIATSTIFGLAHILTNSGWDPGKVTTATLSGFALGLSYLAYGAYASILLHWFFNFYFEVFDVSSSLLGGVIFKDVFPSVVGLLTFSVGILGIGVGIMLLLSGRPTPSETAYMGPGGPSTSV